MALEGGIAGAEDANGEQLGVARIADSDVATGIGYRTIQQRVDPVEILQRHRDPSWQRCRPGREHPQVAASSAGR